MGIEARESEIFLLKFFFFVSTCPDHIKKKQKKKTFFFTFRQHLPQADLGRSVPLRPEGRGLGRRVERGGVDDVGVEVPFLLRRRVLPSLLLLELFPLALHLLEALALALLVGASPLHPLGLLLAPGGVAPLRLAAGQLQGEVLLAHASVSRGELVGVLDTEGGLGSFEPLADIAEVGHSGAVDNGHAGGGTFNRGLAAFVWSKALSAESDIGRPGQSS